MAEELKEYRVVDSEGVDRGIIRLTADEVFEFDEQYWPLHLDLKEVKPNDRSKSH